MVKSRSQDATTARAGKFRTYDDQATLWIECIRSKTLIAVSPGIVARIYDGEAFRVETEQPVGIPRQRSLPCQRTDRRT